MTDPAIFYTGVFCFGLTLVGVALTVLQFNKPVNTKR
jgi:hypothetical protein